MPSSACKNQWNLARAEQYLQLAPEFDTLPLLAALLTHLHRRRSAALFFNDPATTEIYPLPLHDALPICRRHRARNHSRCSRVEKVIHAVNEDGSRRRSVGPRDTRVRQQQVTLIDNRATQ